MTLEADNLALGATVTTSDVAGVFGLDLELGLPVQGLAGGETALTGRHVLLARADPADLAARWDSSQTIRVREWHDDAQRVEAALETHPELGYHLFADGYGAYTVSPDAATIRCAPPEVEDWRWQRCLIGQILPLAAVLRGLEVFHGAAVAIDGRAVGIVGASHAGKSSVAVNLVLRGARLLADDVLALDPVGDGLAVHPGPGVVSVRHAEAGRISDADRRELGTVLGDDGEALRILVPRGGGPVPLGTLYFLERQDVARTSIERLWPPDPRLLLGSTFNYLVATPERLTNQLDICTMLARTTPLFRVNIAPSTTATDLAMMVETHLSELT